MNPQLISDLATSATRDFQLAARSRTRPGGCPAPLRPRSRLRRRIGFTLVEAGLRLLGGSPDWPAPAAPAAPAARWGR